MRPPRNPILNPDEERTINNRRHGRIRTEDLECCLGQVVDLSASGMRVAGRFRNVVKQGQTMRLVLQHPDGELAVECRVAHITRTGIRKQVIGMEFVDPSDQTRAAITRLAHCAHDTRVFL